MQFISKKASFVILGISALICAKALFSFFNDPEGTNLLVTVGMALIIFFLSLTPYLFRLQISEFKKFLVAILAQGALVVLFYFLLK